MARWPLGVFTSLDTGLGVSFDVLARLNIPTIHLHAPSKALRSEAAAEELAAKLQKQGIEVTCVFAGFDGESYADIPTVARTVGLVPFSTREERVAELREISDFAYHMKVPAVGLHMGCVPHDSADADSTALRDLTRELCDYCYDRQQAIHLETGQEPPDVLEKFLDDVDRGNLHINFDPANMILYGCGEPIAALKQLSRFVRSVHCKDAKWSEKPGETWGQEMPLGQGDVDFSQFLTTLSEMAYAGPLTIEREIPQEPDRQFQEIGHAVELLTRLMQS